MHTFTLEKPLLIIQPGRFRHIHLPMQIRKSRNASHVSNYFLAHYLLQPTHYALDASHLHLDQASIIPAPEKGPIALRTDNQTTYNK